MRVLIAAVLLAIAVFWLARGIGIPAWRSWEAGDASDIALLVFLAVVPLASR